MEGSLLLYLFGMLAVAGALLTVTMRHPIQSALGLIVTMLSLAAIYALLDAHFLVWIQIWVYVGAIIILIVKTIMLMDIKDHDLLGQFGFGKLAATGVGIAIIGALITTINRAGPVGDPPALSEGFGTVDSVATLLLTDYVLAFELTSVLLLAGIVAAIYLARRPSEDVDATTPNNGGHA